MGLGPRRHSKDQREDRQGRKVPVLGGDHGKRTHELTLLGQRHGHFFTGFAHGGVKEGRIIRVSASTWKGHVSRPWITRMGRPTDQEKLERGVLRMDPPRGLRSEHH